jgi:hypothetical protein
MKLFLILSILLAAACATNPEVDRVSNGGPAREIVQTMTTTSAPAEKPIEATPTTTTTVPAEEKPKPATIIYFLLNGRKQICVKRGAIVTLSWKFENCDPSRTLWDLGRLPNEGTMQLKIDRAVYYRVRIVNEFSSAVATVEAGVKD